MSEPLIIQKSIDISAPIEVLWRVLTDSQYIQQYMFGCIAESDWEPGSPLVWKGATDGTIYVKGHIVSIDRPRQLAYTVFDPNSTVPDIPENYLTMTCDLEPRSANASTLKITQGDFAAVASGRQRYEHSLDPDDAILHAIKRIAEAQTS